LSVEKFNLLDDIYYQKDYISLYLKKNESIFEFNFNEGDVFFYNIAIKRPITQIGNVLVGDGYFDLETVYGYGGYYTNSQDEAFIQRALTVYNEKCTKEKIIAEFIRFHPFNNFPIDNPDFLKFCVRDRDVVYVDLNLTKDERWSTYSKKTRNLLRHCEKQLSFDKDNKIGNFPDLYNQTMHKKNAEDFYYFDNDYYQSIIEKELASLFSVSVDGHTASSGLFMFSDIFAHYHLSANNYEMRQYNANYHLLDRLFQEAKKSGKSFFLLGGGTTSCETDTLLKFKKKFSKLTKGFYIGGNIYNAEIYDRYNEVWDNQAQTLLPYFLKYRLEIR
jgi:UDP-N-acetylbacillosamine alanyltransferase